MEIESTLDQNFNQTYYEEESPLQETPDCEEIGQDAIWTLSSAKQGNGVEQLRDDNVDTFWQSDGKIPHDINIQFMKKTKISHLAVLLDFKNDESYTPSEFTIRGGIHMQNLIELTPVKCNEPNSWLIFPLTCENSSMEEIPYIYTLNL